MRASLRALLAGSIDYAGGFPPASLTLDQAITSFTRYRAAPDSWMLARFVCRAAELDQLSAMYPYSAQLDSPLRIAVVARASIEADAIASSLVADLDAIKRLIDQVDGRAVVDALELRLPVSASGALVTELLPQIIGRVRAAPATFGCLYLEVPHSDDWPRTVEQVCDELATYRRPSELNVALKFRTGGVEPTAFPTPEQLAKALAICRRHEVAWKATAGLHQAFGSHDAALAVWRFGFLNLLAAAVLGVAHDLEEATLRDILRDERIGSFTFDDGRLAWRHLAIAIEQIQAARQRSMTSFGSCSFDEPREALEECGLWEPTT